MATYGKPLPEGWTAGVMNHGDYYRWWPVSEQARLYAVSLAGLIVSLCTLCGIVFWIWVQRRELRRSSQPHR
ncbi:MAG: hypothetical protein GX591_15375 [Planctomycetes bacterium]|nr:hypothetical protein [Planctomycetota bacterium]